MTTRFDLRKFTGAAAAIVLNTVLIAALLLATIGRTPPVQPPKERITWLSLPPRPKPHEAPLRHNPPQLRR